MGLGSRGLGFRGSRSQGGLRFRRIKGVLGV